MRRGVLVGVVLAVAMAGGCDRTDASAHARGAYKVREAGVALRSGGPECAAHPGPATCPTELTRLRDGQRLFPVCQQGGQTVGHNPFWLYAIGPRGNRGWVPSWYLDYPANRLPGVPECTADLLRNPW